MHRDKPIHVAHEYGEALPGALAIDLALGVGQPLQHGRGLLLLLPFLLEPVPLGGLPLPFLLLVLHLLRLARQFSERGLLIAEHSPEVLHLEAGLQGLLQGIGDDGACPLLPLHADEGLGLLEFLGAGATLGVLHEPLPKVADEVDVGPRSRT